MTEVRVDGMIRVGVAAMIVSLALACTSGRSNSTTSTTAATGAAGASTSPPAPSECAAVTPKVTVVAAENFWGSIAAQLGGRAVSVTNVIDNPQADPHDYEPTADDARTFATATYIIVNGVGYDAWATRLVAANPASGRTVMTVADVLGARDGDNPHFWFSPTFLDKVIAQITLDYKRIDPADAACFDQLNRTYQQTGLAGYHAAIARIKQKYAGTPVGATESIFSPMAEALGLNLLTPASFLNAISEGAAPSAADKATCDAQVTQHQIRVLVFNPQNATPDVQRLVDEANATGVPIAHVTETPVPASLTFQEWQLEQLQGLEGALAAGTGH